METRALKDVAADAFRLGRYARAAEVYAQLATTEPHVVQHRLKLGDSYRCAGSKDQAVVAYRSAVKDYNDQGLTLRAIATCKLILEVSPGLQDIEVELARLTKQRFGPRPGEAAAAPVAAPTPAPPSAPAPAPGTPEKVPEPNWETVPPPDAAAPDMLAEDLGLQMALRVSRSREPEEIIPLDELPTAATPPRKGYVLSRQQVPLLKDLPKEAFSLAAKRMKLRRFSSGEVILREGDPGTSMYFLLRGRVRVVRQRGAASNNGVRLATLGAGTYFGEMAVLSGEPRTASVVAEEACDVLVADEELVRDLAVHASVWDALAVERRQRTLSNVRFLCTLFRPFGAQDAAQLITRFVEHDYDPEQAIILEGQPPDALYVVVSGSVAVTKEINGEVVQLATLGAGDVFGEMSLLNHEGAVANVTAKTRVHALALPKPVFDELLFTHPSVLEEISDLAHRRAQANAKRESGEQDAAVASAGT